MAAGETGSEAGPGEKECIACGAVIDEDAVVCPECDASLDDGSRDDDGGGTNVRYPMYAALAAVALVFLNYLVTYSFADSGGSAGGWIALVIGLPTAIVAGVVVFAVALLISYIAGKLR